MRLNFPRRLFLRALILQIAIFTIGYFAYKFFVPEQALSHNSKLFGFVFFAFISVLNLMIILAYVLRPLLQIVEHLTKMVEDQVFNEMYLAQLSAYDKTPGEWQDLERVIKRLVKIIRKSFKALSREKIEIQAVMNSVEEPIFAIDQNERVVFYNPAFGMVFGLEAGTTGELLAHQVVADANLLQVLRTSLKKGIVEEQFVNIHIGGQVYVYIVSVAPLKRETDSSTYGVVAVLRDRTQQMEINKKRLDFVANASHELRTPIAMISSSVSMIERSVSDPAVFSEVLGALKENTSRLVDLTDSLLDLSSLEGGEAMEIEVLNCAQFTDKAFRLNQFENKNIEIVADSDLYVYADPKRLLQVITNLVTNALRYSPGEGKIRVTWEKDSKGSTVLKVRDHGPGIAKDLQRRIFERFYRVDQSRSRKLGGIGIGLSIVNHIMKLHKGEIYVNPTYENGAEFVCVFPVAKIGKSFSDNQ